MILNDRLPCLWCAVSTSITPHRSMADPKGLPGLHPTTRSSKLCTAFAYEVQYLVFPFWAVLGIILASCGVYSLPCLCDKQNGRTRTFLLLLKKFFIKWCFISKANTRTIYYTKAARILIIQRTNIASILLIYLISLAFNPASQ